MLKRKKILVWFVFLLLLGLIMPFGPNQCPVRASIADFITRSTGKLMDGTEEFRFISVNCPFALLSGPNYKLGDDYMRLPDDYELEDMVKTVVQSGGKVIRTYTLPVRESSDTLDKRKYNHVIVDGSTVTFREESFERMDRLLQLCDQYGVRLIIPLVDNNSYSAGQYTAYGTDFYNVNSQANLNFKAMIDYLVNRTNTHTGFKYKDEKAILCWETGNELSPTDAWTEDIATYIKNIDTHHLVMDGKYGISSASLNSQKVDIVTNHLYVEETTAVSILNSDRTTSAGKKPYICGEVSPAYSNITIHSLFDSCESNGTSGILYWALRGHNRDGGFYKHQNFEDLNWPGFQNAISVPDIDTEKSRLDLICEHAYEISGQTRPSPAVPDAPVLLSINDAGHISWQGSTGAQSYIVERSADPGGPWEVLKNDYTDNLISFQSMYCDETAEVGQRYYYRVKAVNSSGTSVASNIAGPIIVTRNWLIDDMFDLNKMYDKTSNIENIKSYNSGYEYNEDIGRVIKNDSSAGAITYKVLGYIRNFKVFGYKQAAGEYTFYASDDGVNYAQVTPVQTNYDTDIVYATQSDLTGRYSYLKICFNNSTSSIGRVEIAYTNNLVDNSGFETGDYSIWTRYSSNWSITTEDKHSGMYSVKLQGAGDWYSFVQDIAVSPDTEYKWSFYGKSSTTGVAFKVFSTSWVMIADCQSSVVSSDWIKYTFTFNSGSNSKVKLYLADGGGTHYFDDFEVFENNYVDNPGFESGNLLPWVTTNPDIWYVTTEDKYSGAYSVKLDGTGLWHNLKQVICVRPNTNYTLNFYGKSNSTGALYKILDASGNPITSDYRTIGNNLWTNYTLNFNSGNNIFVKVYIGDGGGTHYFDDFTVYGAD